MAGWLRLLVATAVLSSCAPAAGPLVEPRPGVRTGPHILFASSGERDDIFARMEAHYPHRIVAAGSRERPLPQGAPLSFMVRIGERDGPVDAFMADQRSTGILILHDGRVRLERYGRGHGAGSRWPAFSVTKSFTSTLVGAALQDGAIRSLDDPITRYIPELAGSGYDGVTVRQLLTMTSGVRWDESETDPDSDLARFNSVAPEPGLDMTVSYMRGLPREAAPGTRWNYNTGETNLVGVLVERATGQRLADYLSRKIWRPYGMADDAIWVTNQTGHEIGGGGLVLGLRDLARFGQFVLDGGIVDGRHVVPPDWFRQAGSEQASFGSARSAYGYQWWVYPDGTFAGAGIFGQGLFVDPGRRLVVALAAHWPDAWTGEWEQKRLAFFRSVQQAIDAERPEPN